MASNTTFLLLKEENSNLRKSVINIKTHSGMNKVSEEILKF